MLLILSCMIQPSNTIYVESMADFLNVNPNEIVLHKKNTNQIVDLAPSLNTKRVLASTPATPAPPPAPIPDPCAEYEDSQK